MVTERPVTYPVSEVVTPRLFYQTAASEWAKKAARPVSLRQLAVFGRKLTEEKLIQGANYIVEEMAIRLAHRILDMQRMPYRVMSNPHMTQVFEKYTLAFDRCRKFGKIKDMEDNARFCVLIADLLDKHGNIVPDLIVGVKEIVRTSSHEDDGPMLDQFMRTMLMSRISRRVIAEQHYSLTQAFNRGQTNDDKDNSYIGEVFLQCRPSELLQTSIKTVTDSIRASFPGTDMPIFEIEGDVDTAFPYLRSHIDYILGEILRNSVEASILSAQRQGTPVKPILISVSSTNENVFIRVSDQGGGIPLKELPSIWSFAKPMSDNDPLLFTGKVALALPIEALHEIDQQIKSTPLYMRTESDNEVHTRDTMTKLGIGIALARVYAEYWGGAFEIHSLENYGCDSLLRISRLGTKLEQLHVNRI